jgi:hypothetical protein
MNPDLEIDNPLKTHRNFVRRLFEEAILASIYAHSTPLGIMTVNGEFWHYMDTDTDTLWLGFVLGVQAAEQLNQERSKILRLCQTKPATPSSS